METVIITISMESTMVPARWPGHSTAHLSVISSRKQRAASPWIQIAREDGSWSYRQAENDLHKSSIPPFFYP